METNLYRWYLCVTTGTKGDMIVNSEMSTSDLLCTLFGYTYIKGGRCRVFSVTFVSQETESVPPELSSVRAERF